jgi:phosphatidylethanolamine-binding protein (PEBP) family uncharacterized protein
MFSVSNSFSHNEIVPDVIPTAPEQSLAVIYENDVKVELGNTLTPTQVKDLPKHIEWNADKNAFYTLIMTDPDAPSRKNPKERECLHWLVINIPGNDLSVGHTLTEYVGSGPPRGTGLHRYVFLVYKQPQKLSETIQKHISNTCIEGRPKWRATKFAETHHLGNPVAGNFYQAEYDQYVDELFKRILANNKMYMVKTIFSKILTCSW